MKLKLKYQAILARTETRTLKVYCEAESEDQAMEIFDKMLEDSEEINFDSMKCVNAEDHIQDIVCFIDLDNIKK